MTTVTATGSGSPILVPNLSAGNWNFSVKANNGIGAGSPSATSSVVTVTAPTGLPTTGPLYTRCSFGLFTGSTGGNASDEATFGAKMKRYNTYQVMGINGASNFPTADAAWCQSTGHTLDISWDCASNCTPFAQILQGANNASLDAFFQACKSYGSLIYLRMWWEMNEDGGPTKPVSGNLCTSRQQWIQTWQYVVNRCKITNGCTNVKFTYCPGGDENAQGDTIENMYPGSAYVDELGFDVYNNPSWSGSWQSFQTCVNDGSNGFYTRLTALDPNLPISIGELGTSPGTAGTGQQGKDQWLTDMFNCTAYPRLRNINYFSTDQGGTNGNQNWALTDTSQSIAVLQHYLPLCPQTGSI